MFRQEVEQLFHEGVRQFSASDYAPAARTFEELVREYPESHRITAALLMEAKARYFLGMYRESVRLLRTLFDLYPESSYTDDAHYTLGLNYFRLRRYEEAAGEFLVALQTTDDKKLSTRSEEWLDQLASESLSIGHLQLLLAEASNDEAKALLTVHLAARIFRSGDAKTAEELIRPITQMPPRIRFVGEALKLLERISKGGVLKIGVLLPLVQNAQQESEKQAGQDLLEGVRFAVEEYNQAALPKLSLEIRDTEYDADIASRQTAELCADKDVVALVGPALSKEAFLSASIANYRGVPMVTPTATAQGIAATGKHIFQANPDFDVRGRALAQYAMSQLGARTVAVLAPDDEVGRAQTDAFLAEATANGADVVSVQWYTPDTTDLRQQLMAIRTGALQKLDRYFVDFTSKPRPTELEAMLQWGIPQATLDTLLHQARSVPVDSLFGENGKLVADSLRISLQSIDLKIDSLHIPVKNLDALFLPISSPEEIAVVSSQVRLYNFQSALLGGGEWNDIAELDQNRRYTNNLYFPSDSYWREEDEAYKSFAARFERAFNRKPSKNALYTYDAMKLLVKVIAEGAHERANIAEALAAVRGYQGIHSKISFTEGRVNGVVTILQFKNRAIVRINEVDVATGQFWSGQD